MDPNSGGPQTWEGFAAPVRAPPSASVLAAQRAREARELARADRLSARYNEAYMELWNRHQRERREWAVAGRPIPEEALNRRHNLESRQLSAAIAAGEYDSDNSSQVSSPYMSMPDSPSGIIFSNANSVATMSSNNNSPARSSSGLLIGGRKNKKRKTKRKANKRRKTKKHR